MNVEGISEDLPVANVHGIYPLIDPNSVYASQAFKNKVVFLTGVNTGNLGHQIALTYAKAGAKVAIGSRRPEAGDAVKQDILKDDPSISGEDILPVVLDVVDSNQVKEAAEKVVEAWGRLDVVLAVAGKAQSWEESLSETDPNEWWDVVEVNIRGVYNVARYTLPHLTSSKGYFVAFTSMSSQLRIPNASSYGVSKHAVTRLVEFIQIEHPAVHTFAFHPGSFKTPLALKAMKNQPPDVAAAMEAYMNDSMELPACTLLYLTEGRANWLLGRYVSANWDLGEVEAKFKDSIIEKKALVSRLSLP
ncbi:hypothetical protein VKT23_016972 [Stygiomarasmius scandens]|uniref:NAD-P-binding protein n=1 Tax=Marasmiellus scandens TaxID=2682957 RepID=A0ABR1ITL6_9AGAR